MHSETACLALLQSVDWLSTERTTSKADLWGQQKVRLGRERRQKCLGNKGHLLPVLPVSCYSCV
jgi:hypothetical protein